MLHEPPPSLLTVKRTNLRLRSRAQLGARGRSSALAGWHACGCFPSAVDPLRVRIGPPHNRKKETTTIVYGTKVGIFFGTSTGSTQEAADLIAAEFGTEVASSPIEIDEVQGSIADEFAKYDALVVGTPTWNTGADREV